MIGLQVWFSVLFLLLFPSFEAVREIDMSDDKKKVLDCKASEHEYLHKDFHGALCYAIKYLDDTYDHQATREYLTQVGRTYFAPLSRKLQNAGLSALEKHWREIFNREGGRFELNYEGGQLVLRVHECPAIAHLKKIGQLFTDRYCQTTVVVNKTICAEAGFECSCDYEPGEGRCVQKFWKQEEQKA